MEYRCISADCHVDLSWLPHDLFTSNATQSMKDHMPYVTHGEDGPKWVTKSGLDLGLANGKGGTGTTATGTLKYTPGASHRMDRIASTGLFADGVQGIFRPTTPELRLQDQERDGIQAEVMYGLHGTGKKIKDRATAVELYRIYNDWLADFCSYDRQRFIGLASIPSQNVDEAVTEARRVAKLGLGGLDFAASYDMVPLWNPYWDPFWKIACEVNLPVHFHTIGARPEPPVPEDLPKSCTAARRATQLAGGTLLVVPLLAAMIHSGVLERYPNLKIVLGESGIGWIPYVLHRMDSRFEDRFKGKALELKMKPSEYWRRQCKATFQYDPIGAKLLDDIGIENVMWASDYPHSDGVFPDSQEFIKRQFGHLPSATQRKVTCENAAKLYGLIRA